MLFQSVAVLFTSHLDKYIDIKSEMYARALLRQGECSKFKHIKSKKPAALYPRSISLHL